MKQRVFLSIIIILLSLPACVAWSQEETSVSVAQEAESSRQLRIFREALQQGSTEDIRVEAAVELLLRNDPASRDVLVTALKSADNSQARLAVCKALIKSRGLGQAIGSRGVFLEPLMQLLITAPSDLAATSAEALLMFDFSDVEPGLNAILQNGKISRQARINAVYALQIRPEPQALRSLIGLLDDPDAEISKAAENALQEAFGIPIGTSRKVWSDILDELKQKSPDDIRRERLLRQEMKLRQVQAERDRWQKLYLTSLDRQYDMADEAGRAKMTLEMLGSDLTTVRLWALGRVAQYQAADKEPLREKLLSLLSDDSRDVRLQTAKVLNNMSVLNPAQKLLERFKVENDSEVALAMFDALGEACFFAFSPGSEIDLSADIKAETLNIAVQYLHGEQTETSRKGAEVIRKMLELNSLEKDSIRYYLDVINQRYQRTIGQNPVLRADLLSVMASLCSQGLSKPAASKLYEDAFLEAMPVADNAPLRLAAVRGMNAIDPAKAFKLAKQNQLMVNASPAVRLLVIQLAGTSGDASDLEWLLKTLNSNGQTEHAWQSINSICRRQKSSFLLEWIPTLEQAVNRNDYVREILELAEQKALAENNEQNLLSARAKIIQWYTARKAWEQGIIYLNRIQFSIQNSPFDDMINADILGIYLFGGDYEKAVQVLQNELVKNDLTDSSWVFDTLNTFLNDEAIPEEIKRNTLDKFMTIGVQNRPRWKEFLDNWSSLLIQPAVPEEVSDP